MTSSAFDPDKDTICDVIRRWAETQPDAPVFVAENAAVLTFSGLLGAMEHVRDALWDRGLGRGDRVAMVVPSGPSLASLIFGTMCAAVPFPLKPDQTETEFEALFDRFDVRALIVEEGDAGPAVKAATGLRIPILKVRAANGGAGAIEMAGPDSGGEARRSTAVEGPGPSDDCMMVMTSGTTGNGKAVSSSHRRRLRSMQFTVTDFRLTPEDRYLLARPLYYAGGIGGLLYAPLSGGSVAFLPEFTPERVLRALRELRPTWYSAGPTVLRALHAYLSQHPGAADGSGLRFIRATSGALEPGIAEDLERHLSVPIIESYSTTEGGRIASNPLPPGRRKHGTVGLPIDCEVAIASPEGGFLAVGERGEIVVRGQRLADIFENQPENAAAAPSPFKDGWYHTGDEGFLDSDGYLTLTGRIKEVINRGGEKVSPADVDAALMAHEDVSEAATFPIPHRTLGEEVAAAVVLRPGSGLTQQKLTCFLLTRLAGFKVPRRFFFVDAIPKGENGKLQRYSLAEVFGVGDTSAPIRGPEESRKPTALEARLAEVWKRVLKLDRIGLNDDFFMLGGDSLQAVGLIIEIEQELKRTLPVACLFEAGTLAGMAELIESQAPSGCIVPIQPSGTKPPFFCVHGNGGETIGFYNLAKRLGTDQPFYGIQSVGWDGTAVPFTSSHDMAAHYVAAMREVQPKGPYYFGGYSFGGRIAIYMANILREAGEEIALLALLDPSNLAARSYVTFDQWLERNEALTKATRLYQTASFAYFRSRKAFDFVYERVRRVLLFSIWRLYRERPHALPKFMRRPDRANRLVRLEHGNLPHYDGDAVHFRAQFAPRSTSHSDKRESWRQVVKGSLEVVEVPGLHHEIIQEPYVAALAEELRNALDRASAEAEGSQHRLSDSGRKEMSG